MLTTQNQMAVWRFSERSPSVCAICRIDIFSCSAKIAFTFPPSSIFKISHLRTHGANSDVTFAGGWVISYPAFPGQFITGGDRGEVSEALERVSGILPGQHKCAFRFNGTGPAATASISHGYITPALGRGQDLRMGANKSLVVTSAQSRR